MEFSTHFIITLRDAHVSSPHAATSPTWEVSATRIIHIPKLQSNRFELRRLPIIVIESRLNSHFIVSLDRHTDVVTEHLAN